MPIIRLILKKEVPLHPTIVLFGDPKMKNKNIFTVMSICCLWLLCSCKTVNDIPYFQNVAEYNGEGKGYLYDMTIKPKDKLTIFVFSSNPEGVVQFNITEARSVEEMRRANGNVLASSNSQQRHSYLVDNDGNISFPIVGTIHVAGKTIEQTNAAIKEKIRPYIKEGLDFTVNTLIDNYEITVMGEVNRPSTFTITRNKVTVLEALAMAGDMTIYGKRDNVKLLREQPNGEYEIHELDFRDANLLNSPYYYMQQRDILYVEPNPVMAQNASIGRTRQLWVRGISITISLGSLLYRVLE